MITVRRHAGRPLAWLLVVGLGWIGVRVAIVAATSTMAELPLRIATRTTQPVPSLKIDSGAKPGPMPFAALTLAPSGAAAMRMPIQAALVQPDPNMPFAAPRAPSTFAQISDPLTAMRHNLLELGYAQRPNALMAAVPAGGAPSFVDAAPLRNDRRWSASMWLLARAGDGPSAAPGGQYGGSQAGLVVRRRVAGHAATPLDLYARLASPLGSGGREAALGVSWRPFAKVPLSVSAERRLRQGARDVFAMGVAGGMGPLDLPAQFRLEGWAQAGVLADGGPTAYFDGAATATRRIAKVGPAEIAAGGGVWAGGQTGTARLDAGPRATATLPVGGQDGGTLRLGMDWRFRLAGEARPGSGPAVTLSTDF